VKAINLGITEQTCITFALVIPSVRQIHKPNKQGKALNVLQILPCLVWQGCNLKH